MMKKNTKFAAVIAAAQGSCRYLMTTARYTAQMRT